MNILSHWQRSSYPPLSRNRQYTANCVGVRPTIHHLVQIKLISTNLKYLTYDTKENKRKTTPPTPTPQKIRGSWYFFSRGGCPLWEIGKEVRGLFLLRAFIWRGGELCPLRFVWQIYFDWSWKPVMHVGGFIVHVHGRHRKIRVGIVTCYISHEMGGGLYNYT